MDTEQESGYERESGFSASEEEDQDALLDNDAGADDAIDADAELEEQEGEADTLDLQAETEADDLPAFEDQDFTEEEREQLLEALGDDAIGTIEGMIERRLQARLASMTHSNIHLARQAQAQPEFYKLYGAQSQAILSKMKPEVAATKQGVQMAALGAIAQKVMKTGDLAGALIEAGEALKRGRTVAGSPPETKPSRPLPPEARTPSPNVGKRAAPGARGNGRSSAENTVNALAEMVGTSPNKARRYFEE